MTHAIGYLMAWVALVDSSCATYPLSEVHPRFAFWNGIECVRIVGEDDDNWHVIMAWRQRWVPIAKGDRRLRLGGCATLTLLRDTTEQ